ncbi:unnamed protein product [Heterobilharzia americana]|nr:unnamed protein product [Heterobilharzia americana]
MDNPVSMFAGNTQHHLINSLYMSKGELSPSPNSSPYTTTSPSVPHHFYTQNYPLLTTNSIFYSEPSHNSTNNVASIPSILTNSFETPANSGGNTFDQLNVKNSTFYSESNLSSSSSTSSSASSSRTATASNSTDELPSIQIPMSYSSTSFEITQHSIPTTSVITSLAIVTGNNCDSLELSDDVKHSYMVKDNSNSNHQYDCNDLLTSYSSTPLHPSNYSDIVNSPLGHDVDCHHLKSYRQHEHQSVRIKSSDDYESPTHRVVRSHPSNSLYWRNSKESDLSSVNKPITPTVTTSCLPNLVTATTDDVNRPLSTMNRTRMFDLHKPLHTCGVHPHNYHRSSLHGSLNNEFTDENNNIKINPVKQEYEMNPSSKSLTSAVTTMVSATTVETVATNLLRQQLSNSLYNLKQEIMPTHQNSQTSWSSSNCDYSSQKEATLSSSYLSLPVPIVDSSTEVISAQTEEMKNPNSQGHTDNNDKFNNLKPEDQQKYHTTKNIQNINHKPTYQIALSLTANFYPTVDPINNTLKHKDYNSDWEVNNPVNPRRHTTYEDMLKSTQNHLMNTLNEYHQGNDQQLMVITKQNEQTSLTTLNNDNTNYYHEHFPLSPSPLHNFDIIPYCNGHNLFYHQNYYNEIEIPPFIIPDYNEPTNQNQYYLPNDMNNSEANDLLHMNRLNYSTTSTDTTMNTIVNSSISSSVLGHNIFDKYNNESYINSSDSVYSNNCRQIFNNPHETNQISSTNLSSTYLTSLDKVNNNVTSSIDNSRGLLSDVTLPNHLYFNQLPINPYDHNVDGDYHHHSVHPRHPPPPPRPPPPPHHHHQSFPLHQHHHQEHEQQHSQATHFIPECTNLFINTLNHRPSNNMNQDYYASLLSSSESRSSKTSGTQLPYKYSSPSNLITSYDSTTFLHEMNLAAVNSKQSDRISHNLYEHNIDNTTNNNSSSSGNSRMSALMAAAAVAAAVSHNNNINPNLANNSSIKHNNIDDQLSRQSNAYSLFGQSNNLLMAAAASAAGDLNLSSGI